MAYARWGCDGSDVYVFMDVTGGFTCCCCELVGENRSNFATKGEMVEHLLKHREAGHVVPEYAIESIRNETEDADVKPEELLGENR